ncbi:class I SAM-dependent DNA methyltransferase [Pengzhenrongella sicca]|uniref:Methyltransferase domain-containing protein n=1 Tax=Pengzhenrongella sicca TaxID=2819238 RepID=A0A8A4ZBV3_9MICO|nr:class I SAM-dependent methyltransferase [Pengzhenrongella sicca]QTE29402.1 methyltransferase domain-containing protein [Pengzhenrongella sicca]
MADRPPSRAPSADDVVRAAYSERAAEYAAALGSISAMDPLDVRFISEWAARCRGPLVDAGCGPGHWTHLLTELGADVEGVDLVPAFVELARTRFPTASYRVARLDALGTPDQNAAGILAWYSLIHLEPVRVPAVLDEFRRCLRDDGTLVLGFFASARLEPFPHAFTTAYSWPVDELTQHVENAGFVVRHAHTRPNPARPDRQHGVLLADRA